MKIIENVTLYECDFCKRKMRRKGDMTRHEKNYCKENPANQDACLGCKYAKKEDVYFGSTWDDDFGNSYDVKSHAFRCTKLDKLMYPFKAERHAKKYPESFENQERMPTECKHFMSEIEEYLNAHKMF